MIYDTKILATECSDLPVFPIRSKDSSLQQLYQHYVKRDDSNALLNLHPDSLLPRARIVAGSSNSTLQTVDDSFMIGTVFQCLCRRIKMIHIGMDETENIRDFYKQIAMAKHSRVGSLLFLDDRHPFSKLSAPLYGLNKVRYAENWKDF